MSLEIEIIDDLEGKREFLAKAWSGFDQAAIPEGLGLDRIMTWWRRYGAMDTRRTGFHKKPRVVLIHKDGRLAGILPLMMVERTKKKLIRLACLEFLTQSGTGHFLDIIHSALDGDEIRMVFKLIAKRLQYDQIHLCYLREDSILLRAGIGRVHPHAGKVIIPLGSSYDSIRCNVYSKNLRHILSKFQRRINESKDAIQSQVLEGKESIARWKDEIRRVSLSKLEEGGMHSVYQDPQRGDIYFHSIADAEKPFCSIFFNQDQLLSYNMGYIMDDVVYAFDAAYNRKYAEAQKIGLGILAYDQLVEHYAGKYRELDMGFGLDDYKFRFSKRVVYTKSLLIKGNTLKGRMYWPLANVKNAQPH